MVTSSLRDFLRTAKQQLRECQKSKTPVTLVMGNDKADIDTIAATLIFAYLRSSAPPSSAFSRYYIPLIQVSKSSLSSIMHLPKLLPHLGIEVADLLSLDDMHLDGAQSHLSAESTHFFLVNWNFLEGRQGENFSKAIEGCIDIHQDSGYVPKQTSDLRIIGQAGSCTSLAVNALREEWQSIGGQSQSDKQSWSKHLASLGLAGVLGPTKNLQHATSEDESAYKFLAGAYGSGLDRSEFYHSIFGGETMPQTMPTTSAPPQALGAGIAPIEQHRTAVEPPTSGEYMSHNTFTGNRLDPMAQETVQTFHEEVLPEHLHGSTGRGLTGTLASDSTSATGLSSTHQSENRGLGSTMGSTSETGYGSTSQTGYSDTPLSGYGSTSATGTSSGYTPSGLIGSGSDNYGSNTSMLGSTTVGGSGNNYTSSTSNPSHALSMTGSNSDERTMTEKAADAVGMGNSQYGSGSTTSGTGYGSSTTGTGYNNDDRTMTQKGADAVGLGNTQYGSGSTTSGYGNTSSTTTSGYGNTSSTTGTESLTDNMRDTTLGTTTGPYSSSTSGLGSSSTGDYSSSTGTTGRSFAPGQTSSTTTSHPHGDDSSSSGGFLGSVMGALGLGGGHHDSTTGTSGTHGGSSTSYEGEGVGRQTTLGSTGSGLGSSTGDYSSSTGTSGYGSTGRDQDYGTSTSGTGSSVQDKTKELVGDAQFGGERGGLGNGSSVSKNEMGGSKPNVSF